MTCCECAVTYRCECGCTVFYGVVTGLVEVQLCEHLNIVGWEPIGESPVSLLGAVHCSECGQFGADERLKEGGGCLVGRSELATAHSFSITRRRYAMAKRSTPTKRHLPFLHFIFSAIKHLFVFGGGILVNAESC